MRVDLFDFDLPQDSIALRPARPRDSARMLVVRGAGQGDIPFDDCYDHGIYAVCTYGELLQESAEQEHCIMSYHRKIRAKTYSVFTKPYPKRVTIGISINKHSARPYAIDQIRGYKNCTASEETLKKIYQWFDKEVKKYRLP